MSKEQSIVTLAVLAARLHELEQTNVALQERVQLLEAEQAARTPTRGPRTGRPAVSRTTRRKLLQLGGAAAAATAAAVALGQGEVAHAATGSNLVLGQANDAGATTTLSPTVSTTPSPALMVNNSGATSTAIEGHGTSGAVGVLGTSDSYIGVQGTSPTDIGVYGQSSSGAGVYGFSSSWTGVLGECSSGAGVSGTSISSIGVAGNSTSGAAVFGASGSGPGVIGSSTSGQGGLFSGGQAPISLAPAAAPGAPTTGAHIVGDIWLDSAATLYLCTASGTPGTWVRLAGVANGASGGTVNYLAAPKRLLDARSGATSGLTNRGPLTANEVYALSVAGLGGSGIPAGALGLICNVTVLNPSANGNLSLFPAGAPIPTTASMTFVAGAFLANHVSAALGSGSTNQGKVNIQNQSGGNTPLVVDAVGFIM